MTKKIIDKLVEQSIFELSIGGVLDKSGAKEYSEYHVGLKHNHVFEKYANEIYGEAN